MLAPHSRVGCAEHQLRHFSRDRDLMPTDCVLGDRGGPHRLMPWSPEVGLHATMARKWRVEVSSRVLVAAGIPVLPFVASPALLHSVVVETTDVSQVVAVRAHCSVGPQPRGSLVARSPDQPLLRSIPQAARSHRGTQAEQEASGQRPHSADGAYTAYEHGASLA